MKGQDRVAFQHALGFPYWSARRPETPQKRDTCLKNGIGIDFGITVINFRRHSYVKLAFLHRLHSGLGDVILGSTCRWNIARCRKRECKKRGVTKGGVGLQTQTNAHKRGCKRKQTQDSGIWPFRANIMERRKVQPSAKFRRPNARSRNYTPLLSTLFGAAHISDFARESVGCCLVSENENKDTKK